MSTLFCTNRLKVFEIDKTITRTKRNLIIEAIPKIITANVAKDLPPYFSGINSPVLADSWLNKMLSESRVFIVELRDGELIGFIFVSSEDEIEGHIGYLIAERYWGKGIAGEMLCGFIKYARENEPWHRLIGGVEQSNVASIRLLEKMGFCLIESDKLSPLFFEYRFNRIKD